MKDHGPMNYPFKLSVDTKDTAARVNDVEYYCSKLKMQHFFLLANILTCTPSKVNFSQFDPFSIIFKLCYSDFQKTRI